MNLKYVKGSYMDEIMVDGAPFCLLSTDSLKARRHRPSSMLRESGTGS